MCLAVNLTQAATHTLNRKSSPGHTEAEAQDYPSSAELGFWV